MTGGVFFWANVGKYAIHGAYGSIEWPYNFEIIEVEDKHRRARYFVRTKKILWPSSKVYNMERRVSFHAAVVKELVNHIASNSLNMHLAQSEMQYALQKALGVVPGSEAPKKV